MVSDDDASRAVWLGPDGVLAHARQQAFAIECSTLSHSWVLQLADACRAAGLRYLDCPVTGLPDAAAAGRLTLLVGATDDDLAAARDVLAPLADQIVHFGGVGTGTAYKLMVNLIGAVQIASVAEGLALAERVGLDLDQFTTHKTYRRKNGEELIARMAAVPIRDDDGKCVALLAARERVSSAEKLSDAQVPCPLSLTTSAVTVIEQTRSSRSYRTS